MAVKSLKTKIKLCDDLLDGRHKKLSTRELRENLAEALTFTSRDRGKLILTKNGEDRAALVSIEDVWLLDALDELKIKDALKEGFNKHILWNALKVRLSKMSHEDDGGKGKKNGDERRRNKTSSQTRILPSGG